MMLRASLFMMAAAGIMLSSRAVAVAGPDSSRATIIVEVPDDAKLYFNDQPTQQSGAMRTFTTPALAAGKAHVYELRVEMVRQGQVVSRTEQITVRAGQTTRVAWRSLSPAAAGYLYTLNNDLQQNGLIVLRRQAGGSLEEAAGSPFPTGGRGLGGGDIDEQGAVRSHGDYVLAVNSDSDSVAVLRKGENGALKAVPGSPFPSGGSTPLSLAVHGDLVYVANQAAPFANPSGLPNLMGFRLDRDGRLTPIPDSRITFPAGQGPAQVEFSPDGSALAVTSGFQSEDASRIHSYKVQANGTLREGPDSPVQPRGASGVVGFSWSPDG